MKIHLLEAEHFSVPGRIVRAFTNAAYANRAAVDLVNSMLTDNGNQALASPVNWKHHIDRLQDEHGAQFCYVEVNEADLEEGFAFTVILRHPDWMDQADNGWCGTVQSHELAESPEEAIGLAQDCQCNEHGGRPMDWGVVAVFPGHLQCQHTP